MSALSGAQHLAQSGRTSFPVDKALPRDAYRVLGYRQCGERAVRVDILERLADLIRPALAWRETSPGEKPAGAFDGRGFVVTQAMTSLTGSAGEDFASILRALGYRMDKRPPLPPKPAPGGRCRDGRPRRRRRSRRVPRRRPRRRQKKSPAEVPVAADCRCPAIPRRRPRCCPTSRRCRRERRACGCGRGCAGRSRTGAAPAEAPRCGSGACGSRSPGRGSARGRGGSCTASEARREAASSAGRSRCRRSCPPKALPRKPNPMRRPSLCWSKSGGPAAVPRSAVRITTATASVITAARPKAAAAAAAAGEGGEGAPREQRHRRGRRQQRIPQSPARARRRRPRLRRRRGLQGAPAREVASGPSAARALRRQGPRRRQRRDKFDRNKGDRNKGGGRDKGERGGRDFGGRDKGGRDKRDSGPRTVNGRPAPHRASAIVRSIPIRRLQNWRR